MNITTSNYVTIKLTIKNEKCSCILGLTPFTLELNRGSIRNIKWKLSKKQNNFWSLIHYLSKNDLKNIQILITPPI